MRSWVKKATKTIEAALACALTACVSTPTPTPSPMAATAEPVVVGASQPAVLAEFAYDSLDDRPVTSAATRGKPTVIVFVQTGSVWSQAQVNFIVAMAKNDGERVNYLLVALEPRESRELVEDYRKVLGVTFPTALADTPTMFGAGPFGALKVPTTVILDRVGKIVWRADARVAKSDEIRGSMKGL